MNVQYLNNAPSIKVKLEIPVELKVCGMKGLLYLTHAVDSL